MMLKLDWMGIMVLIAVLGAIYTAYDNMYCLPMAADAANEICQAKGWDFYESFDRVGLLSREPVAIVCKYVDQYQKSDINIQGSVPVSVQE